jgi:bacterial leucyl aminopeptidase
MKFLPLVLLALPLSVLASPRQWVTVDAGVLSQLAPQKSRQATKQANGVVLLQLTEKEIESLSHDIHHDLKRCGGYVAHESEAEALEALAPRGDTQFAMKGIFNDYAVNQQRLVEPMVAEVSAANIEATISALASFHNRFYKADTGVQSSTSIRDMWASLSKRRSDIKVELFNHAGWPQPSVIVTIEGSTYPDEIIVLGGHADSISGGMFGSARSHAPGADDNASGIATLTETLRVAVKNGFKPARTVQFMAYAAEEVGLLGSKEIANLYKREGKKVVGKLQLDMTLRKGTPNLDIVMMSDFTNQAQNEFLGKLIDEYVKVAWGYSRCGYGCSDHASWTNAGFPASIPFESTMGDINRAIHTPRDTLENAGGNANHAAKFAKLAIAYMVELAN